MDNYVPYDTNVWTGFVSYIKGVLGPTITTGIIIMACIIGVLVVIRIIKHFARG